MVFRRMVAQNHLFLEKKMVSNQKTIFFSRKPKNQKTKKTIFSKTMGLGPPKDGFLVFSRKRWFFGAKPSFSREKDGFWRSSPGKTIFFSRKRWFSEGCLLKTIFFSRKRWFRTKKTSFSRENQKNQKNEKNHLFQNYGAGASKRWFFWFFGFLEKKMVFWFETIFFSRKRWFYQEKTSKNHLFLEKKMVSNQKTIFFSRKPKKPKKPSFPKLWGWGLQKMVFLVFLVFLVFSRKRWFFWFETIFSREKDGSTRRRPPKTIFFSRKRWFYQEKTSKNHLFLEKKMVSNQKNHLFLEKTKKTIFWRPQPHSFGKDGFFGFFGFLFFVSFLFCCCSLDLARTRMPPAVGPLGGVSIYIYITDPVQQKKVRGFLGLHKRLRCLRKAGVSLAYLAHKVHLSMTKMKANRIS